MTFRPQYQRNTGAGRAVDTGPPRTNSGLTGLGAVGGPTGVGAGALRVIVEFLTQYDSKELKKLETELNRLQGIEEKHNNRMTALRKEDARSQGALTRLQNIQNRAATSFTRAQLREIKDIRDLERSRTRGSIAQANVQKDLLAKQTGFRKAEISQLVNADKIQQRAGERRARWAQAVAREEAKITANNKQQQVVQQRVGMMQNVRANVLPKLGSLALGAAGGVFGGALVGVGFAAAEALIGAVGAAFEAIIDPGKEARQTLDDFAESVNKLANAENLTILEATKRTIAEMGALGQGLDADVLAAATAWKTVRDQIAEAYRLQKLMQSELNAQRRQEAINQRFRDLRAQEPLGVVRNPNAQQQAVIAASNERLLAQATREVDAAFRSASAGASQLATEEARLASQAAIAAIAQERLQGALSGISGMKISGLQDQAAAIGSSGPSARTQQLQAAMDGLAESQARANYASQMANIQQERGLILLEKRIRFGGEAVRLETLSAQGQIIAIDARIEALQRAGELEEEQLDRLNDQIEALRKADAAQDKRDQKELEVFDKRIAALREQGDFQDRLNRLLDLQYRMSQRISRNQGESIGDFLARRANEQRSLLAEQASLRRDEAINTIEGEKKKVEAIQETANERREAAIEAKELEAEQLQDRIEALRKAREAEIKALRERQEQLQLEVRLQKLAEQEKQLAQAESFRKQQAGLAAALKASQAADAAAVTSRQTSINKQIAAEEAKLQRLLYWTNQENITRLQQAVNGAETAADLNAISGELNGAKRVLGELRALVAAGVLPASMVSSRIAALVAIIRQAESKMYGIRPGAYNPPVAGGPGPLRPLASGGVFSLNNAMNNPFGANIRTGEEGQEIGVVLSNKVARILRETQQVTPDQTFIINRSDDPYRDKTRFARVARDAVSEMLG